MRSTADQALLLTPPGGAAIAVIRLSGTGVQAFLRGHFSKTPRMNRAVHGDISDGGKTLDDPVVVLSSNGAVADINVHGGPWVVRSVLELARRNGFEMQTSDVPARTDMLPLAPESVDADSDLERDILTHLHLARTELGVRALLAQRQAWAGLELTPMQVQQMRDDRSLWWLLHPPTVAIVGQANVGKSTLANQLFARECAITADLPGTTRDWVGEMADIDGLPAMLIDTPGLRQTSDLIEVQAMAGAQARIADADLIIVVIDASRPDLSEQLALLEKYPGATCILNKWDKVPSAVTSVRRGAIQTIATTGQGITELRGAIAARFGCRDLDINRPRFWTS